MTIDELLTQIGARGVQIRRCGSELILRGNQDVLDTSFIEEVRSHKTTLGELVGDAWSIPSRIRPEMLPLVELTAEEIERIVSGVPGGAGNVQDIYPLAPLQEGILFHHLMGGEGDPYLLASLVSFDSRVRLDSYLGALQAVIGRHDILRTAVVWEGLSEPVQVVWREAVLAVEEVEVDAAGGDVAKQLYERFNPRRYRMDVRQAPLLRVYIAQDRENERWLMMQMLHHLAGDHSTLEVMQEEVQAHLLGQAEGLPVPLPFRNLVAQARLGISKEEHEAYFRRLLGDVEEPTAPFGLLDVQGDGTGIEEARMAVTGEVGRGIRERARKLGVSAASVCHLAWAQVLARVSGREDVVFGTVLFGRMQGGAGAERVMGLFINTLPVRIQVGEEGAEAAVRRTQIQLAELLRHEHASLALAQRCSGVPAPAPLFSALLNYRHSGGAAQSGSTERKRAWEGVRGLYGEERTNYPLTLSVDDIGEGFGLTAQVTAEIGALRVCEYMRTALESLVAALEREPERAVQTLEVLPEAEREQVLYEWNRTEVKYPADKCVHELFEEQVERTPEAVAVVFEDGSLSYGELNGRANRLAHYLRELGVKPDARVGICLERGFEMIIALLGVLKAGGAYVPLDPGYPEERKAFLITDSEAKIVLSGEAMELPEMLGVKRVHIDTAMLAETNTEDLKVPLEREAVAYIMYTSGSTGRPKGVMVPHRAIQRLVLSNNGYAEFEPSDGVAFASNPAFDAATMEVWAPLLNGGRIVVIDPSVLLDAVRFGQTLRRHEVSILWLTVGLFNPFADTLTKEFGRLRYLIVGGDALDPRVIARVLRDNPPQHLINGYGPTETTTFALTHEVTDVTENTRSIPIGRPIANTRVYILDRQRQAVPVGVAGELYIGGAGVARGYLNRPELTAERFLQDPFTSEAGARMYKTGDLGRWLADGNIEFLGRNDFQVKIRGFRIELGEIEARLAEQEGVREAVVVAREDEGGDKRLVAYYTCVDGSDAELGAERLRGQLAEKLPEYMVPAAYVRLEKLPLTANGKLDRKGLPEPEKDAYAVREYEAPQTETEAAIAGIWSEVLKVDKVGRQDHFFELGGHSLLAVRVVTRLRQALDAEVAIRDLFAWPVLADLARGVESAARATLPSITRGERGEGIPLSFAQRRLWFLAQMEGVSEAYHIPLGLRLDGELDRRALRQGLDRIVARHEALRTTFVFMDGEPVQRIVGVEDSRFQLIEHDLRQHKEGQGELERLIAQEAGAAFDLQEGPLIRGRLIQLSEEEHVLLITMHHIVSDGWSMGVLINELSTLYGAFVSGEADPLPALEVQYADYAVWQRKWMEGEILGQQAEYWKEALAGAPALLELPGDHGRPGQQEYAGAFARLGLDEHLTAGLKELSKRQGTTLYMTLLAGWAALLARLSGQEEVVIGTPVANRSRVEIEGLIGFFVNTLALRVDVSGSPTVGELLERVKGQAIAGQQNQDIPFEQVVEIVRPVRSLAHSPVFQVMFTWQNASEGELQLSGLEVRGLRAASRVMAKFDLTLSLQEAGERIVGGLEYATALFERSTIERYEGYFRMLLEGMVADATQTVDGLPMLSEAEREQVLYEWNRTEVKYPADKCVHELFEEQVERTPEAVAVVFEDGSLSYGELNGRANRLAHYLRELGVKPDARVGICLERGFEMIIALLGVLKAGGAYVPLDPGYPEERLRYMLEDSGPVVLLTQGDWEERFRGLSEAVRVVDLTGPGSVWNEQADTNPDGAGVGLTAEHLAYVIYTSGSTGTPKGVMVEHSGVCNYLSWALGIYTAGSAIVSSSFSFDATVTSLYTVLLAGGTVRLLQEGKDIEGLHTQLQTHASCGLVKITPGHLDVLGNSMILEGAQTSVSVLVIGGEILAPSTVQLWRQIQPDIRLVNEYGPTETVVGCIVHEISEGTVLPKSIPIGKPIANTRVYILDRQRQAVPVGVAGELYIGGAGVARGYLNRPELTAERFLQDPFTSEAGARMYKTGDLGRWLADGNIEFLGRNDFQVKIRGFRIELGEIEARLAEQEGVREAVVVAREDEGGDKRLVAYYTCVDGSDAELGAERLRGQLAEKLPEYMVPAAYVRLEKLPLTANGKLDRKGLPEPEKDAYAVREYEAPQTETEAAIAGIWSEVLKVDKVGRQDHFFELGGHSLLAITVIERMRRIGLQVDVRTLFETPTVAKLAAAVGPQSNVIEAPANRIPRDCTFIRPEMLPLVELTAEEIERIVSGVPGGAGNVQDIYPLAPLQEGILFHHLMGGEGDPYLLASLVSFDSRVRLDSYLGALQAVIGRHDILRTAVVWEGLSEPVQVVWREAVLAMEEVEVDAAGGDVAKQLYERFNPRRRRMDVRQAPLLRAHIVYDPVQERWLMMQMLHHLAGDHSTLEVMQEEVQAHLLGQAEGLPAPLPFRNLVAQARLGISKEEHEAYFRRLLGDVEEPTAPFGLLDVQGDGTGIEEARMAVTGEVGRGIRERARKLGVSAASVCHLAWAQVLARVSGREDVVFGTVLFGRMQGGAGAERVMGLFINTLPVRIQIGEEGVEASVRSIHAQLAELLQHEHASLALAQRCSGVPAPAPLFSALLNYRHSGGAAQSGSTERKRAWEGVRVLYGEERTNYPLTLSVDDLGEGFGLTAQVTAEIGALRVCEYMRTALESLVAALEREPERAVQTLEVLPEAEREQVLYEWNRTEVKYPADKCVHELFEEQVERTPEAVAVVFEDGSLSYGELNGRANRLAHYLRELGVKPDARVGICLERGFEMIIALLGVLKAGGAYVPLDPGYPEERLRYMLEDSGPVVLLTQGDWEERFRGLSEAVRVVDLTGPGSVWNEQADTNPDGAGVGLTAEHLAYVIYTSGSTGTPKGVMNKHGGICNRLVWMQQAYGLDLHDAVLQKTSFSFDVSVWEFFWPLLAGARLVVAQPGGQSNSEYLLETIRRNNITTVHFVPSMLQVLLDHVGGVKCPSLVRVVCSGEELPTRLARRFQQWLPNVVLHNLYGPTEAAVDVTAWTCPPDMSQAVVPIGRPIANTRVYILDRQRQAVPVGVAGELYIGGAGVARGYLNRPELTAERFLQDPFTSEAGARMYKTGDLGRWLADGNIEFLGRNDFQVKIRGFRIELGEIEARLAEQEGVREAVVVAREDEGGDKRLVAYYTCVDGSDAELGAERLRGQLAEKLPEYMVPAAYVRLEKLPLTANGKLDRKGLPEPEKDAYAVREYEAPQTETEAAIAGIWSEVLKVDKVGRQDHFFELGGHSLLAVRVVTRLRQALDAEVAIRDLFAWPVLADLARGVESAARATLPSITRGERGEGIPLSFAQRRLWFLAQMEGVSEAYHIPLGLRLDGELDRRALRQGLDRIVARHEALRTTFVFMDGEPVQRIVGVEDSRFQLIEHDLRQHKEGQGELERLIAQEAGAAFDLQEGPLIRGRLIQLSEEEHVLLITMHHIVSDGWSMGVLINELSTLYGAFVSGEADPLPALEVQYADYAVWQRKWMEGEILGQQAEYWKEALAGAPALLELPGDHGRPGQQEYAGAFARLGLDEHLTAGLKELSKRQGTTLYMTLLAGWAALLARLSGQEEVVIGTPVANRSRVEIEGLIGFFVNTLALRVDVSGSPTVGELLERVKGQAIAGQQNQDIPFEQVVEIVRPVRSLAHSPVFQVMFAWQNASEGELQLSGLEVRGLRAASRVMAKFDLTLSLQEAGERIVGGLEYATALFERSTIERYEGYFRMLLEGMVADATQTVDGLPMLSEAEREQVLYEWNRTEVKYPADKCVHELFEEQVERTPEAVAVVFEDGSLSYGELNGRANRLAHYLRELGVKPDARVGICLERGFEMIIALLGVLKAGGAYVPLDPGYPEERLRYMLEDSGPVVLLTQGDWEERFRGLSEAVRVVDLTGPGSVWNEQADTNPDGAGVGLTAEHLAYVIYTSGSTGTPKGVMVEHRGLRNLVAAQILSFAVKSDSHILQFASFSFDACASEIFTTLCSGASLHPAQQGEEVAGEALIERVRRYGITHATLPPGVLATLSEAAAVDSLDTLIIAGDALANGLVRRWARGRRVINAYGPTETTVCATLHDCQVEYVKDPPIGKPIANTRVYILDRQRQAVPVGVAGELYIGGAGVARGYLNRPELTAERFLQDPFTSEAGARMYKTGDLGRWLADGNIEFLGRNDFQVKIRGFRIELGEIEARLAEQEGVREAVVVAREDEGGDKRLVAYYTCVDGSDAELGAERLRGQLAEKLPEYMVPAAYVRLEKLPLTANGKLDRKGLPEPEKDAYAVREYEAPQTETEAAIAGIWSEVLKVDKVGRQDHFFELGGHSLLAVRVVTRLRQALDAEVAIRDLFAWPVLADLARGVESAARATLPSITRGERGEGIPLSFAQRRLWFLAQMEGVSEAYHIPLGLRLDGELDRRALRQGLDRIVARHEALRTTFVFMDGEPVQRIVGVEDSRFQLIEHDLRQHKEGQGELERLIAQEAGAAFDLQEGPLIRGRLIQLSEEEHVLLITMHHIVSDGWSMGVLINELSTLYGAFVSGEADPLPALEVQYADYAVWQRKWMEGEILGQQAEYWKEALAGAPALLELPGDHGRPGQQEYAGAFARLGLDEHLTAGLKELSKRQGTTLYMTLLAGWAALLARLSGQEEVVIGTPVANRSRVEIEGLIGFFVNTLALRVDVSGSPTVGELLERVKGQAIAGQQNQDIPFEQVVEIVRPVRSLAHSPVFQVMFAWQNASEGELQLSGLEVRGLRAASRVMAKFDLTLSLQEAGERIVGGLEYATALFERSTIERYEGYFRMLLEGMVADATQTVDGLPMLSEAEREQVLYEWNRTEVKYPADKCVHELFEEQVERTPEAVAVVFEDGSLSYGELNGRANRLAHYLRELGVKPDARVGICLERGFEMIIALLGVLKAGGAYVPLDPGYPEERLRYMLEDSGPVVLLTQGDWEERFRGLSEAVRVVDLTGPGSVWNEQADTNPDGAGVGLTAEHLAYVIYTSGSTGTPKGVMVEHANVARLFSATDAWFRFEGKDVWSLFHSYAFDFSVWEIWGALFYGGRLIVVSKETARSPEDFYRLVCREKVTILNQTPTAFRRLIAAHAKSKEVHQLRRVIFGGESLEVATLKRWYEQSGDDRARLINMYGITETTVHVTYQSLEQADTDRFGGSPIGCRIPDLRVYILDRQRQAVPVGVAGELYIGGAGVARGYLNRPELTAERFLQDPFTSEAGARMYKTGDLGRWLADGNIEFLGRNDFQVKIRGFRIELGEIEARLAEQEGVREAVVVAREDEGGDKRLVAYYTCVDGSDAELGAERLRGQLAEKLPEYMVPAAYVRLEKLPLTANGKLDRKGLPEPEKDAYAVREYEAPQTETEAAIAGIWSEVLKVDKVGRQDHFFELGGHSLLAITVIERMRRIGLQVDVRTLFEMPTLAELAAAIGPQETVVEVPPNRIPEGCEAIRPEMLPLVELTAEEIERIVSGVPGGAGNVQDIYPLAPLQEGILFHHLMGGEGDPYLLASLVSFDSRVRLDSYLGALQAVIGRHDILRTAVVWEGLSEPVQVVWREAVLAVEEVEVDAAGGDVAKQLYERFNPRRSRMDVRQAPLLRVYIAQDRENERWLMMQMLHHLAGDHSTLEVMQEEVQAHLLGQAEGLPVPLPFRNLVAQARLGISKEEHEAYFRRLLGDVEEPTAPFGLLDVQGDGTGIEEARMAVTGEVGRGIRERARKLGVSAASVCHLAWAQVLARVSGREDVVFGTVLFGRMQGGAGAERVMGLFINTLPVRIQIGEEGVEASVRSIHAQLAELLQHEHASLALAQRCSGVPAPAPLFSALLNYRHSGGAAQSGSTERKRAWEGVRGLYGEERTNYPLTLSVDDLGEGFGLTAQVTAEIGALRVCEYMRTALESLVAALEREPERAVQTLEVLPEAEREQVLYEWNRTEVKYPADKCVHELFEEQVERTPEAVAVVFEDGSLSYGELNGRANRLAHYLRELGVKPDVRVGICLERGFEMIIALLGVLKAGGAYVPLDPGYPEERLRYMLEDSGPVVLLTQGDWEERFRGLSEAVRVVDLTGPGSVWNEQADTNPDGAGVGLTAEHLAYVIYTSGSTGTPKGVAIEHRSLVNLIHWHWHAFELQCGQRSSSIAALGFDAATWEIWPTLCVGASLALPSSARAVDPETLLAWWENQSLDVSFLPTPILEFAVTQGITGHVHTLLIGGDRLRRLPLYSLPFSLVNNYGPTEATIVATSGRIELSTTILSIGKPIANTRVYILDRQRQAVPVGVAGELYIGGAGVARGYLNRPELTAERFLQDPFTSEAGARMYKTGDLGRWLADGNIEFLGRNDFQVKIRGFRIELGEIEARLAEQEGVREAVVVAREDEGGDKRLVAYYTCVDGSDAELGAERLRGQLAEKLPEYMVPAAYVRLEKLPLTANGKLDRKGLPEPEKDAYAVREYEAPQTETEAAIAGIWSEVLKVDKVGRQDHFFELGGHSLLAITVIERMRRIGLQVDVRTLFETPTVAKLAAAVGPQSNVIEAPANRIPRDCTFIRPEMLPLVELTAEEIERIVSGVPGGAGNVQDIYPLAPLQEGILFHHLMGGEGDPYLLASLVSFDSRVRLDSYLGALQAVIGRHDILRTAVVWEGLSEPVQVVWREAVLAVEEVEVDAAGGDVAKQLYERFNPRRYRMDVRQAPLLRVYIAQDRENERWLMMQMLHHLAGDHSTLEVMQEEVQAHLLGQAEGLPVPLPFRNLVAQARLGISKEEHEAYFRRLLGDVEEPTAPFGLLDVQGDGTGIEEARMAVTGEVGRGIRERARKLGVSAASVCHLAWAQVLARVSGREDVVFGTVLFGRMQGGVGAERVMGLFINTLPVRIQIGEEGVEASVRSIHAQLAELLRHEHASLALAQRCSGVPAPAPLFSALLNYRHSGGAAQSGSTERKRAWEGVRGLYGEERTNYPLTLSVDDIGERFGLTAQVTAEIGALRVCEYMRTALESLVAALEREPERAVQTLEVLPEAEREQVLYEWNRTEVKYPADKCVHELFEEQVERTPEAVAVVFEDGSLSYGELNGRANRLAHYLRELGVKPDARVGICLERGFEMIIALLGVLKAGGAYVPLDPGYPEERLRYMLEDSGPVVLLTQGDWEERFRGLSEAVRVVDLTGPGSVWNEQADTNPDGAGVGLTAEHLAYVIYTSGSTGTPKGVAIEHRNTVNLICWAQLPFAGFLDRTLFSTSLNFDLAVYECFVAITVGARVRIVANVLELARTPFDVTLINSIPSAMNTLLEEHGVPKTVRVINLAGEPLKPTLVEHMFAQTEVDRVCNLYGPSETTTYSTWVEIKRGEAFASHIGKPIANTRVYILDRQRQAVPVGVAGELYIGGAGVARGYLNRPELTAERFLQDPFTSEAGARMYKTGDLGRWLADGNIEFLGRNDFQVKIRGFRIELGEIEARLAEQEGVREAVVVAREDEGGDKRLVAYYTCVDGSDAELGAERLRGQLAEKLPEYMVPAAYVRLEKLPLTANGKLDRKGLPEPEKDAYAVHEYEAPQTETEAAIAGIWSEVLKVDKVGRQDHFFELGGHSLLAITVIERMRRIGLQVDVRTLFEMPTLAELAAAIGPQATVVEVPPNGIPEDCETITPEMLPLC